MGETTIQWCDYTFNPWVGCQRVSPGCQNCYAEAYDKRVGGVPSKQRDPEERDSRRWLRWGPNAPRTHTSASYWKQPKKWQALAVQKAVAADLARQTRPVRPRVFCASLADVFEDRAELAPWRLELLRLIFETPHLDWLLLTKRPENIRDSLMRCGESIRYTDASTSDDALRDALWRWIVGGEAWPNIWLGTTVEDQRRADERIPELLAVPSAVRFLSCEPLLGRVDLMKWLDQPWATIGDDGRVYAASTRERPDWVIIGGESGPAARPFDVDWARDLVRQCRASDVAPFVKQLGRRPTTLDHDGGPFEMALNDPAGGDPAEWPVDLRVREFPIRKERK